jgi:D-glycerate 3-kinase
MDRDLARRRGSLDPALLQQFALPLLGRLQVLAERGGRPVIGLNAPVGAGKSTLCRLLSELAPQTGLRLAVASIDDFYLPWDVRCRALAGNPFAVTRVPPGSHDPALLCRCLDDWRGGAGLRLPRFDKTLRDGEGDRCGEQTLQADALVLEGWLLGCRPLGPALEAIDPPAAMTGAEPMALSAEEWTWLPRWDRALEAYQPAWARLDELWLLRPLSWSQPRRWRFQAEARQRRAGGATLSAEALARLVRASLCSLPPKLYQDPLAQRADSDQQADVAQQPAEAAPASGAKAAITGRQGPPVGAVGVLDGRRRLVAVHGGRGHSSASSSPLSIG